MSQISKEMPEADEFGFVKTLNNQGFMTTYLDEYSQAFVDFVPQAPGPALDIGAAYGIATLATLKKGGTVIANDVDEDHLKILESRVKLELGLEALGKLRVRKGRFPTDLAFSNGELGAVLACRVFHFFDGPTIEEGVRLIHKWLAKDGRFYLVGETPYLGTLRSFIPLYEEKIKNGDPWPGFIPDFQILDPIRGKDLPKQMHLLDEQVLSRVFREAGFQVEKAEKFPRPRFSPNLQLDGRESVGIIGIKK